MTTEPKTAEERVKLYGSAPYIYRIEIEGERLSAAWVGRETVRQLVTALQSMHDDTREAAVRECCAAIQKNCGPCDGTGGMGHEGEQQCQCEYCGRPIAAIYRETGVTPC